MEAPDLVVRNGLIVDGGGGAPFAGDIAIRDGRITVVGQVKDLGREEIDARGMIVTPGFVDIHTHYDGQAIWADRMAPSSSHGVTTVVMGNCGVGFAPCRPGDRDLLVSVMEGVEDIPGIVMADGLSWSWETFPQFLDALEPRSRDIDVAAQLPHSPLRVYVMGERGVRREPATAADLDRMAAITREAIDAGALGVSTSRMFFHRRGDGAMIPSYAAADAELHAIVGAMGDRGVFQAVLDQGPQSNWDDELSIIEELARTYGRPTSFTLAFRQTTEDWRQWSRLLDRIRAANDDGVPIKAQMFCRPIGVIQGLECSVHPFALCPSYRGISHLPLSERVTIMRDPIFRAKLLAEQPDEGLPLFSLARNYQWTFPLGDPPDYAPLPESSIAARAVAAGVEPGEIAYDLLLERDGQGLLLTAAANYPEGSLDIVRRMMGRRETLIALGDGGAHYGMICDSSYPTFMLAYWARDREIDGMSLPEVVRALSAEPAAAVGLADRGLLQSGYKADLNIIDHARLRLHSPKIVHDLPSGGSRLDQTADGYVATIVSGKVIARDGRPTGVLPGQLVRGSRMATAGART